MSEALGLQSNKKCPQKSVTFSACVKRRNREEQANGVWGRIPLVAAVTLGRLFNVPQMHFPHLGN